MDDFGRVWRLRMALCHQSRSAALPRWGRVRAALRTEALQDVCGKSLQTGEGAEEIEDRRGAMVSQHACGQNVRLRGEGARQGCCEAGPEEVGRQIGKRQRRW